jgi:hypothetical protein
MVNKEQGSEKNFRIMVVGIFEDVYEWEQSKYMKSADAAKNSAGIEFQDYGVRRRKSGKYEEFFNYFPLKVETTKSQNGNEYYTVTAQANFVYNFRGKFHSLEDAIEAGKKAFDEKFGVYHSIDPDDLSSFSVINALKGSL